MHGLGERRLDVLADARCARRRTAPRSSPPSPAARRRGWPTARRGRSGPPGSRAGRRPAGTSKPGSSRSTPMMWSIRVPYQPRWSACRPVRAVTSHSMSGPIGGRGVAPVGGDRRVHEAWVDGDAGRRARGRARPRRPGGTTPASTSARPARSSSASRPPGVAEVEGDAALAAVPHHVAGRSAPPRPARSTRTTSAPWSASSIVVIGPAMPVAEVEHPDAVEDPSHDGPPFHHDQFALLYREHHRGFVMGALERNVGPG